MRRSGHFGEQKITFFLTGIELRLLDYATPLHRLLQPGSLVTQTSPTKFSEAQTTPANALSFQFLSLKREINERMTMAHKTTIRSSMNAFFYSISWINRLKLKQAAYAAATLL
jgi:hypothetical protein